MLKFKSLPFLWWDLAVSLPGYYTQTAISFSLFLVRSESLVVFLAPLQSL